MYFGRSNAVFCCPPDDMLLSWQVVREYTGDMQLSKQEVEGSQASIVSPAVSLLHLVHAGFFRCVAIQERRIETHKTDDKNRQIGRQTDRQRELERSTVGLTRDIGVLLLSLLETTARRSYKTSRRVVPGRM